MCLCIHLADRGGSPEEIQESQKRRYADVGAVDRVIELDNKWKSGESY